MTLLRMTRCTAQRRATLAGTALLLMQIAPAVRAVDAIVLEVRELTVAGIPVSDSGVRLELSSDEKTRVTVKARSVKLPDPAGSFTEVAFVCDRPVIAEPRFGCEAGKLAARGGPTGALDMQVRAELRSDSGVVTFSGKGLKLAGTSAVFDGRLDGKGWQVKGSTGRAKFSALRKFIAPWLELPADITGDGDVQLEAALADAGAGLTADVTATIAGLDLNNEAGTIVTDKMAAKLRLRAEPLGNDTRLGIDVAGSGGQVLVNPILLDFGRNALALEARGNNTAARAALNLIVQRYPRADEATLARDRLRTMRP